MDRLHNNMSEGGSLAAGLVTAEFIPDMVSQMIMTGEENGNLAIIMELLSPSSAPQRMKPKRRRSGALFSDVNGKTAVARDLAATPQIKYGPYLKRSTLPVNPIDGTAVVTLIISGATLGALDQPGAPAAGDTGW